MDYIRWILAPWGYTCTLNNSYQSVYSSYQSVPEDGRQEKPLVIVQSRRLARLIPCVATTLDLTYERQSISITHRLPAPRSKSFHPSIVIQFVSSSTKAEWISAAKKKRIQTTGSVSTPVIVLDDLTP
ncbi:hypothetical protein J6590_067863 [Homalodisca vitripennis]|nr:hypothetical protein J6590_067863 [Homalodisca vitripennis]